MYDASRQILSVGDTVVFNASGYLVYGDVTNARVRTKNVRRLEYDYKTHRYSMQPRVETLDEVEISYGKDKKTWTTNSKSVMKIG